MCINAVHETNISYRDGVVDMDPITHKVIAEHAAA